MMIGLPPGPVPGSAALDRRGQPPPALKWSPVMAQAATRKQIGPEPKNKRELGRRRGRFNGSKYRPIGARPGSHSPISLGNLVSGSDRTQHCGR
eukprot:757955-Hanusia_phi.AAC.5